MSQILPNINTEMSGSMNDTNQQAYWELFLGFTFYLPGLASA